ncbi:histidine phosphatase family protein [Nitratireductor indicus]|uniref:histidine phosphatase family protein n=1 Tax=Nitratireductor indicus TaxID=721133 RepID=UPI002875C989|nr:histidine phosphatase family protein [Nitratireductor indicus]MDS1138487.1 histidine phosphatase family protein [Nitratireductor indicus]
MPDLRPPLLYVIRHGQTDWNVEERLQGQADTDINAVGQKQADGNGIRLAELIGEAKAFRFVSSPLRRTRETMERVRTGLGLPPQDYQLDPRLKELNFGEWEGFTYVELEREHPGATKARALDKWGFVPPGETAESYAMLAMRIRPWLEDVREPTVCVTHGGVIRALLFLTGQVEPEEAATVPIPQDRILRFENGNVGWI